jgi:hypothetical protein
MKTTLSSLDTRRESEASVMRSAHVIDAASGQGVGRARKLTSQSHSFHCTEWAGPERVLIVDPDEAWRAHLRDAVLEVADIDHVGDFVTARKHLLAKPYDWLVTNGRLGEYNGLHLVFVAGTSRMPIRSLVYTDERDVWLAQEVQRAGAFYESRDRLDSVLSAYLRGALPPQDCRRPSERDRRSPSSMAYPTSRTAGS